MAALCYRIGIYGGIVGPGILSFPHQRAGLTIWTTWETHNTFAGATPFQRLSTLARAHEVYGIHNREDKRPLFSESGKDSRCRSTAGILSILLQQLLRDPTGVTGPLRSVLFGCGNRSIVQNQERAGHSNGVAPNAGDHIDKATSCSERLEELAVKYRDLGAEYGLAMGAGILAVEMNGDGAMKEFNAMAEMECLYNDSAFDWQTRLLCCGTSAWALFRCPYAPTRTARLSIGRCDLTVVGDEGWIPCPGSTFNNAACLEMNPEISIAEAPQFLLKKAFQLPSEI
jgi:hypothetical protein